MSLSDENLGVPKRLNKTKDYSTTGSQVVSNLSTDVARRCLTSQIGRGVRCIHRDMAVAIDNIKILILNKKPNLVH